MSDYASEVAQVQRWIDQATDEQHDEPEWAVNLMVCDAANSNPAICDEIARALEQKLRGGSPRGVLHALVLAETLVKNGSEAMHSQIGSRVFLNEVAALTDGSVSDDVQGKALELIKQWADAFSGSSLTAFQDTYRMLKIQGVVFPAVENEVPIFMPPSSTSAAPAERYSESGTAPPSVSAAPVAAAISRPTRVQQIEKLHADLKVVMEKIELYTNLKAQGDAALSEELEDVIDFLRQCQPRMNTLIEGGVMGKIDEQSLEECLNVNDHLNKVMDEDNAASEATESREEDLISFDSPHNRSQTSSIAHDFNAMTLETS